MTHSCSVGDLWSWDRPIYMTTKNIHNTRTSVLPVGFEPAIQSSERLQTQSLGCAAEKYLTQYEYIVFMKHKREKIEIFTNAGNGTLFTLWFD